MQAVVFRGLLRRAEPDQGARERQARLHLADELVRRHQETFFLLDSDELVGELFVPLEDEVAILVEILPGIGETREIAVRDIDRLIGVFKLAVELSVVRVRIVQHADPEKGIGEQRPGGAVHVQLADHVQGVLLPLGCRERG